MAVKDGKIEGVDLLQEAISILNVVGISLDNPKATAFSTMETDLAIKQGIIYVQRLLMDSHDFQATGGGTIGFDQTLKPHREPQPVAGLKPEVRTFIACRQARNERGPLESSAGDYRNSTGAIVWIGYEGSNRESSGTGAEES